MMVWMDADSRWIASPARTANECQTLQGFFQSTVPRILHPTVKEWATEL